MNILLTNDDGYDRQGISRLARELGKDHTVCIVAPDGNRSGFAHGFTLHDPVRFRRVAESVWACSGTPADCVSITAHGMFGFEPDLIISGINYGPNLGTDIIYSGTAAGAREGALKGIPSVAVSLAQMEPPFDFESSVEFVVSHVDKFHTLWDKDHFLNINIPPSIKEPCKVRVTRPCLRKYVDSYQCFTDPRGDLFTFMDGDIDVSQPEKGSDLEAVEEGVISLSPISIHPENNRQVMNEYSRIWEKE
ncbi:MAG: 5'/3'-nucleotidase SurE [Spirochaetales bacterium]|nr:5'/3'-nucleotidase SurE [Spirochaetales bacterium]